MVTEAGEAVSEALDDPNDRDSGLRDWVDDELSASESIHVRRIIDLRARGHRLICLVSQEAAMSSQPTPSPDKGKYGRSTHVRSSAGYSLS